MASNTVHYTGGGMSAAFPAAASRTAGSGAVNGFNNQTLLWTSSASGDNGLSFYNLYNPPGSISITPSNTNSRTAAMPVMCIQK
ncbi:hypothetical protein FACS1894159_02660 [Bacteroidia bacterium]|nr:hypothetical protein FACS1894159_02660 [Bacteroidia bacterium]